MIYVHRYAGYSCRVYCTPRRSEVLSDTSTSRWVSAQQAAQRTIAIGLRRPADRRLVSGSSPPPPGLPSASLTLSVV
jgi:hypothetical protein